jgi:hypothetical protein
MSTRSKKPKRTERKTDWRKAHMVAVNDMNFVRASLAESHRTIAGLREIERKQQERIAELEGDQRELDTTERVCINLIGERDELQSTVGERDAEIARLNRENLAQSEVIEQRDADLAMRDAEIIDLRAEVECGDELIARQRQHCIRLTEIKNSAVAFLDQWSTGLADNIPTQGFDIVRWKKTYEVRATRILSVWLRENIAALEVDSAVPPKG